MVANIAGLFYETMKRLPSIFQGYQFSLNSVAVVIFSAINDASEELASINEVAKKGGADAAVSCFIQHARFTAWLHHGFVDLKFVHASVLVAVLVYLRWCLCL